MYVCVLLTTRQLITSPYPGLGWAMVPSCPLLVARASGSQACGALCPGTQGHPSVRPALGTGPCFARLAWERLWVSFPWSCLGGCLEGLAQWSVARPIEGYLGGHSLPFWPGSGSSSSDQACVPGMTSRPVRNDLWDLPGQFQGEDLTLSLKAVRLPSSAA